MLSPDDSNYHIFQHQTSLYTAVAYSHNTFRKQILSFTFYQSIKQGCKKLITQAYLLIRWGCLIQTYFQDHIPFILAFHSFPQGPGKDRCHLKQTPSLDGRERLSCWEDPAGHPSLAMDSGLSNGETSRRGQPRLAEPDTHPGKQSQMTDTRPTEGVQMRPCLSMDIKRGLKM